MSTKSGIWDNDDLYLYEEASLDGNASAHIEITGSFKIEVNNVAGHQFATIQIQPEAMDQLALAWLKHRGRI